LAPAEGKFYALRDVTGTVPSLPLIASSIISKKIAGGGDAFVFDVKCGSGAFMETKGGALDLSRALVDLSAALGKKSVCLITDMEQPLGEWVGNSVEVLEAVEVLSGGGPSDTRELCLTLASEMLALGGLADGVEAARKIAADALDGGAGLEKFGALIRAQGGDGDVCEAPRKILPFASKKKVISPGRSGRVGRMDARAIGCAVRALGGGRIRRDDVVDPSVGLRVLKKIGDDVSKGEPMIEVYYNEDRQLDAASGYLESAFSVEDAGTLATPRALIMERID
jgi:pyrimidine-nucleoside phosphorylase